MADAKDQAKSAIDEGARRANKGADADADKPGDVVIGVHSYAEQVVGRSREGYRQFAERTHEGIRHAGVVVRDDPGPSVAAAFGVGIAVGVLIGLTLVSRRA
jgi:ElaB/YqjD/DUF883 family membrane-anchored ribosome-binding protein